MKKNIRSLVALTAALALTATAGFSVMAQAETNDKHFSVVEAASNEDSLSIPEIAKKCRSSVVAIETETKVVYNNYDNYYNPFGACSAMATVTAMAAAAAAAVRRNTPKRLPAPASSFPKTATF